ncbi:oligopeptide transport system permease protein [Halopolyspora algeriensis]|uniref:Oligopeptide transport system permease protein n=1 Tax=Halopolyspora algeriensis TaxID=1500506 RepID=A0A368VI03_9ACTN|nr:ABC transporter permease [Halopolyspora algeriensis]RCW39984.1 oligopeptide transport system permease protein [Halopolyspora algeriensis]TQM46579.1 oligopeptide transport system permease protein [Halopolyspora algeriensis]
MTDTGEAQRSIGSAGAAAQATVEAQDKASSTKTEKQRGLWGDAWRDLRRRPLFIVASAIILFLLVMSVFPGLFASTDPNVQILDKARDDPSAEAWFGYDHLGRDIYARVVYGARASIIVGVLSTVLVVLLGSVVGVITGYAGGKTDSFLSRFAEIFLGLPFVLGAIVILSVFNAGVAGTPSSTRIMTQVIVTIGVLAWPICMRIMRSAAIAAKQQDYVKAAKALGASHSRIIFKHVLPNCLAPVMVYATIALGGFIGLEATLSYLGLGLKYPVVSWGMMISVSQQYIVSTPHMLVFPALFLIVTVLAFVMLGDAVRDALDPKQK